MRFCSEMRDCVTMYRKSLEKANAELEKLNNSEYKGSEYHNKLLAEAQAKKAKILSDAELELTEIRGRFNSEIVSRYTPKGAELTDDARLFTANSPIELTGEELNRYMSIYKDNMTMARMIADYAKAKKVSLAPENTYLVRYSQEEKTKLADNLLSVCRSAMTDNQYYNVVLANEDNYAKVTGGALAGE